ncbi:MAG: hypothetical protein HY683_09725 [Chloroflexi bacterium]|nr:hypothetical protein [Chloroflexota bacterium]
MSAKVKVATLDQAAALVHNGDHIAMTSGGFHSAPMGLLRQLLRRRVSGLRVVGLTGGGINIDLLIGAGVVSQVQTCHMSMGEFGTCPNFNRYVKAGALKVLDNT